MATTTHIEINHDRAPVRLFRSDFLEFFTHIHPAVVLIIWLPVVFIFLFLAIRIYGAGSVVSPWYIPLGFLLGLFLWTLTEYLMHRFIFHFRPRTAWQRRLSFLSHGVHHHQPQCKTRLVMPPAASIPLALLFYAAYYLVLDVLLGIPWWLVPTFAGFIAGYLVYDMLHYASHHIPMRRGIGKVLKRHHLRHHYKTSDQRFGVSSPVWDVVFGTQPP